MTCSLHSTIAALFLAGVLASCNGPTPLPVVSVPSMTSVVPTSPQVTATADGSSPPGLPLALAAYTVPPKVTGRQRPACLARGRGQLPDPACTPGSVGTTDAGQVCVPRFSEQRRPNRRYTDAAKTTAMLAYRVPLADRPRTEYDHLVPLSLGGSNDVSNLWPQISDLSLVDERNSKDGVELRVKIWVCKASGQERQARLIKAQEAMARDWTAAEKFLGLSPG